MRDIISSGDLDYIQSLYPDRVVRMPTLRQQQILLMHLRGMLPLAIAKALGDPTHSKVVQYLKTPSCRATLDFLRANEFTDVRASREYLVSLLFESYHKAGTAMEEIAAIREIGKISGLYESDKQARTQININTQTNNVTNIRQLESLSENQLIEIVQAAPVEAPKLPAYEPIPEHHEQKEQKGRI
jgi:hypothetical protein